MAKFAPMFKQKTIMNFYNNLSALKRGCVSSIQILVNCKLFDCLYIANTVEDINRVI